MLDSGKCYSRESDQTDGIEGEWVASFCWETREGCFSKRVTFKPRAESQEGASHGKLWGKSIPRRESSIREGPKGSTGLRRRNWEGVNK